MPTDTKLNSLIINYLTEAQYNGTTPNENELYLTPDGGSEIETIDGAWMVGSEDFTLSKTPASFPFMAKFADSATNSVSQVYFCDGLTSGGVQSYIGFWNDAQRMFAFFYYPSDSSQNAVKSHPYQKKTFLHSITAKGATLSMSFTYPSANQLPVDSVQDAAAVIKPTANEYFASPVVVVATKKISDGYNCIYYDGTSWKFALWDGSTFTDGEAVTAWADSVVSVD